MNALDLIGLASDVTGLSSTIINKLQPEDYQYRSFMNVIDKTITIVCNEYRDFLNESNEYSNHHFPKEYDEIIKEAIKNSISNNESFAPEKILPNECEFPNAERERLYSNIINKLRKNSLEFFIKEKLIDSDKGIKEILAILNKEQPHSIEKSKELHKIKTTRTPTKKIDCIGRNQDITNLQNLLYKSNFVILVNGLGGIGKTELSKEFYFEKNGQYKKIFWYEYEKNIKHTFIRQSKIWNDENYFDYDIDYYYDKIMNYLINQDKDTLVMIDNVDNIHDRYLSDLTRLKCDVIITSRLVIYGFKSYTVGFLSLENCIELFKRNTNETEFSHKTENHIKSIVELCGYHTLTIELLAKTVASSPNLTISKLHNELIKQGFNLKETIHASVPINWHDDNEYRKFFDHLKIVFDIADLKEERIILLYLSLLPKDDINYTIFNDLFKNEYIEYVNLLERKGWIFIKENKIIIHNVIQEIVRDQINPTFEACKELILNLSKIIDSGTFDSLDDKFIYSNWALSISNYIDDMSVEYKDFLNSSAWIFSELGDNKTAINLQKKCLRGIENNIEYDEFNIKSYNVMSLILSKDNSQLLNALKYQKKSFQLRKKYSSNLNISYHNLALIYSKLNYIKPALILENKVYNLEKNSPSTKETNFAITLSTLSSLYRRSGDFDKAISFQKEALSIRKRNKSDKFRLAKSYYLLAILYDLKNSIEAIEYYKSAIKILEDLNIKNEILSICYTNLYYLTKNNLFKCKAINTLSNPEYILSKYKTNNYDIVLQKLRKDSLTNKIVA